MAPALVSDLGGYLREQRVAARLSLRQLSDLAGISNPYLSQIERGLKKPSAEILQQIAHGLQMSAESLYIKAGILEESSLERVPPGVLEAIAADRLLTPKQRTVLTEVYRSFVGSAPDSRAASKADSMAETAMAKAESMAETAKAETATRASSRPTTQKPAPVTPQRAPARRPRRGSSHSKETPWQAPLPRSLPT